MHTCIWVFGGIGTGRGVGASLAEELLMPADHGRPHRRTVPTERSIIHIRILLHLVNLWQNWLKPLRRNQDGKTQSVS